MKYHHLEHVKLTLRALSPVFIAAGEKLSKKEYILDAQKGMIYFPDLFLLMNYLKERGLLPAYESFLIQTRHNDLHVFLKDNQVPSSDYAAFTKYSIPAGEAIKVPNFREVLTFIKDSNGQPYIPGSSIKGAIRTALIAQLLKKTNSERVRNSVLNAEDSQNARYYLKWENRDLEHGILCCLGINDPSNKVNLSRQPVNDLMRGIQISDSAPIPYEQLTLTGKYDRKPDGSVNLLPIFRECLVPGTEAYFTITLEIPIMKKAGIDMQSIEEALHSFADEHYANFEQYYAELPEDAAIAAREGVDLILGGGTGYVSKTLIYNLFSNRSEALPLAAKILNKQFNRHGHGRDPHMYKVAPHTLKTTMYENQYYQMGRCELIIN